jgi:hypothetical protein
MSALLVWRLDTSANRSLITQVGVIKADLVQVAI